MPYVLHYALFPLFVAFCLRFFLYRSYKSFLVLIGISFLIFSSYTIFSSIVFDFLFVSFLFIVLSRSLSFKEIIRSIGESVKVFSGILILLIPIMVVLISEPSLANTQYNFITQVTQPNGQLLATIAFNSPRLIPALFYSGYNGLYSGDFGWYQNYCAQFEPILLLLFTLFLTVGIIVALKSKTDSKLWFGLVIIWVLAIILFTGTNEPFSSLKSWFFQLKYVDLLRSVYARFGEYVILSSLPFICLGISKIFSIKRSIMIKGFVSILVIAILLVSLYPIFSGEFLSKQNNSVPSNRVVFPASYQYLSSLNSNGADFIYLTVPMSFDVSSRSWNNGTNGYIGPDIFPFILSGQAIRDPLIQRSVLYYLVRGEVSEIQQVMPLRYIILTFDQTTNTEDVALQNYFSVFKRQLTLLYEDNIMAVFELPINNSGLSTWPMVAYDPAKRNIFDDLLTRQLTCIIYENQFIDATESTHNYAFREFDDGDLNQLLVNSTVKFKSDSSVFPLLIHLPDNSAIYLRSNYDKTLGAYRIYAGAYSSYMFNTTESLLQVSYTPDVSFHAVFPNHTLQISADSESYVTMPAFWINLLNQQYYASAKVQVGILSFEPLVDSLNINELSVAKQSHYRISFPESSSEILNFTQIGAMNFQATINVTAPSTLFLFEPFSPGWVATFNGEEVLGEPLFNEFVSFKLNYSGIFDFKIAYRPQEIFDVTIMISVVSLCLLTFLVIIVNFKKKTLFSYFKRFTSASGGE